MFNLRSKSSNLNSLVATILHVKSKCFKQYWMHLYSACIPHSTWQ